MSEKLIIIGNGFDLAHGLKTSFSDFVSSKYCSPETHESLSKIWQTTTIPSLTSKDINWNDFENLVKISFQHIADPRQTEILELPIRRFSSEFKQYLHTEIKAKQDLHQIKEFQELFQEMIKCGSFHIASFNYTPTLENIYSNYFQVRNTKIYYRNTEKCLGEYYKIHGNYDEENIVLGYDLENGGPLISSGYAQDAQASISIPRFEKQNLRLINSFEKFYQHQYRISPNECEIKELLKSYDYEKKQIKDCIHQGILWEFKQWIELDSSHHISENLFKKIPFDEIFVLGHSLQCDNSFLKSWFGSGAINITLFNSKNFCSYESQKNAIKKFNPKAEINTKCY